jgi:hypothetical protein
MKPLIIAVLAGAAIAGTIYLLRDNENVKKFMEKIKDSADNALDNVNWKEVGKEVTNAMAEQA